MAAASSGSSSVPLLQAGGSMTANLAAVPARPQPQMPAVVQQQQQHQQHQQRAPQAPWMQLPVTRQGPLGLVSQLAAREGSCTSEGSLATRVGQLGNRVRTDVGQFSAAVEVDQESLSRCLRVPDESDHLCQINCRRVTAAAAGAGDHATFLTRTTVSVMVTNKRVLFTSQGNQNVEIIGLQGVSGQGLVAPPSLTKELRASVTRQVGHQAWHASLALEHLTGIEVDSRQENSVTGTIVRHPSKLPLLVTVLFAGALAATSAIIESNSMWIATIVLSLLAFALGWYFYGRLGSYTEPSISRSPRAEHTVRIGTWDPLYHRHLVYTLEADVNACSGGSLLAFVGAVNAAIHRHEDRTMPVYTVNSV